LEPTPYPGRKPTAFPEEGGVNGGKESPERVTLPSTDHFLLVEERRRAAEGVLWQLPSISLAAQAFLLNAGLAADARSSSQIIVGALGIAAVVGTGFIILYQVVRATIFESWLTQAAGLPLAPDALAIESLELGSWKILLMKGSFVLFYGTCLIALLAFLAVDGYVFGQGVGWW
jgi:hypothetical protein